MADDAQELVATWTVTFKQWRWEYTITADGRVTWRDPLNNETGAGSWALMGKIVNLSWTGSSTKETWNRPIQPGDQSGWCEASYGIDEIHARKATPAGPASPGLKDDLRKMAGKSDFVMGRNYDQVRDRINAASAQEKRLVLVDQPLLNLLRIKMFFNDFAKAVELLGRQSPTAKELIDSPEVKSALDTAWSKSNVGAGLGHRHEEGGQIFINLITGRISTAMVPPGKEGPLVAMQLPSPTPPDNSVCVGHFHTHPNPEAGFAQECSSGEHESFLADGVPGLVRSAKGTFTCGPDRRLHLGGAKGYPGPSGGEPP